MREEKISIRLELCIIPVYVKKNILEGSLHIKNVTTFELFIANTVQLFSSLSCNFNVRKLKNRKKKSRKILKTFIAMELENV